MSPDSTHAHITSQSLLTPSIKAWRFYLVDQGNSIHTVKAFTHDLELMANFLPPDRPLGALATTDINNYLDWMQNSRGIPCSPKTLSRRITSVKAFFRWLHKNGVLSSDPAEKVLQKTVLSPLPVILTLEEVDKVLVVADQYRRAAKPDPRFYALFALLISTGIKKGECLALSPNHVDLETPTGPLLFIRYTSPQHRYKERKISIPDQWVDAYLEYKAQNQLSERLFPWSPRRLEYLLEDLSMETGLDKHISFDMCRWTCATLDWRTDMERDKIRQKLGISKVQWREVSMKLARLTGSPPKNQGD